MKPFTIIKNFREIESKARVRKASYNKTRTIKKERKFTINYQSQFNNCKEIDDECLEQIASLNFQPSTHKENFSQSQQIKSDIFQNQLNLDDLQMVIPYNLTNHQLDIQSPFLTDKKQYRYTNDINNQQDFGFPINQEFQLTF